MSLKLRLYNTSSPSNKINKDLTFRGELSIYLKNRPKDLNELDINNIGSTGSLAMDFNYAHLITYNLYFFAKMLPSNIGDKHNILHLELDPLMTYKSQILGLKCITDRNTNNYNVYLSDEQQKITSMSKQFYHTFRNGEISHFKPHSSILVTLVGSE
jgi:hypothetical protein